MANIIRLKPRRRAYRQVLSKPGTVLAFPRPQAENPEQAARLFIESELTSRKEPAKKKSRKSQLDSFMHFSWPGTKDH